MQFDKTSLPARDARESLNDARNFSISEKGRISAMRAFGEHFCTAIGNYAGLPRLGTERQVDYLPRLLSSGHIGEVHYADFEAIRKLGNKAVHGETIYAGTKAKGLAAFDRLSALFLSESAPHSVPTEFKRSPQNSVRKAVKVASLVDQAPSKIPKPSVVRNNFYNDDVAFILTILTVAWLLPFFSYSISVWHFNWSGDTVKKVVDIRPLGYKGMLFPVLNWIWMLLYTLHHTIMAPFENNQVRSIWLGHFMSLPLCGLLWPLYRIPISRGSQ